MAKDGLSFSFPLCSGAGEDSVSNLVIMVLELYMASGQAGPSGPTVRVPVVEESCTERDHATAPGNQQLKVSDTALQTHSDIETSLSYFE